ncbi:CoA ester lyase [Novosphingobium indicum]|uniref:CoA ester lyase n=1 Tax=Novosphingobium indicum TaxID=462949 RepID=A0ABQ2K0Y2_9SPHN|nr:CoA ester lyase [Novosphingobium indicum]GGN61761.1 CoA ester lyase [Novosphingobium indicum]
MIAPLRSLLFIPGDSERKIAKEAGCGADAVILDLEDAVAPDRKDLARKLVADFIARTAREERTVQYWVRVNPFDTGRSAEDLAAIMPGAPDGIMLPKIDGPEDVRRLSHYLDALEAVCGIEPGSTRILPVATETARAPFALGDFANANLPRLAGLTWGAEDLATAVGASTNLDGDGQWAFTYRMARSLCLLAASAAGVPAIETLFVDFNDDESLRRTSRAARAEGFMGRIAIHPAQVAGINESFRPSNDEVAHARRILDAFEAAPGAGTVSLDGKMIDIPHLRQARQVIAQAEAVRTG